MIELIELDVNIKEHMENIRKAQKEETNAKTFLSAFIWAEPMDIKVYLESDMYAIKNNSHGKTAWNFPVGTEKAKLNFLNQLLEVKGLMLMKLTRDDVDFINKHFPNVFEIEENLDDSEYIYDSIEHAKMSGKKFNSLRRIINKFNRNHKVKTEILTNDNLYIADDIMRIWSDMHNSRGILETSGMEVDNIVIDHYMQADMIGVLIYVDDEPSAISIGYPLSENSCDIVETKYLPFINDIGYIVIEEFMKTFGNKYRYFNYEEDMGIQGLRTFKQRLKPCELKMLYNAYLKGERK